MPNKYINLLKLFIILSSILFSFSIIAGHVNASVSVTVQKWWNGSLTSGGGGGSVGYNRAYGYNDTGIRIYTTTDTNPCSSGTCSVNGLANDTNYELDAAVDSSGLQDIHIEGWNMYVSDTANGNCRGVSGGYYVGLNCWFLDSQESLHYRVHFRNNTHRIHVQSNINGASISGTPGTLATRSGTGGTGGTTSTWNGSSYEYQIWVDGYAVDDGFSTSGNLQLTANSLSGYTVSWSGCPGGSSGSTCYINRFSGPNAGAGNPTTEDYVTATYAAIPTLTPTPTITACSSCGYYTDSSTACTNICGGGSCSPYTLTCGNNSNCWYATCPTPTPTPTLGPTSTPTPTPTLGPTSTPTPTPTPTLGPTLTPTPTSAPQWIKLKNASFHTTSTFSETIPATPHAYDATGDDDASGNFIISTGTTDPGAVLGNPVTITGGQVSSKGWIGTSAKQTNMTPDLFQQYVKSRKDHVEGGTSGITTNKINILDGNFTISSSADSSTNLNDTNLLAKTPLVLITTGNLTIQSTNFNPSGSSISIVSLGTLAFSSSTQSANGIFVGNSVDTGTTANQGLKIKGNLISKNALTNGRSWSDNAKPSLFIINDPKPYLDLLQLFSYISYRYNQVR